MHDTHVNTLLSSALWIAATLAAGVALNLTTWTSWSMLGAAAIIPLAATARLLWTGLASSTSQKIQQALRQRP